ncbi:hypothetical protein [uncultured Roseibium sp.]|uniref:hypothetical protein n=1 Tax=uncultured Roseibium sp. TaxID=1936171 RepID=UPI00321706B6
MKMVPGIALLGGLLAVTSAGLAYAQGETAKWFVLRQDHAGTCTIRMLTDLDGGYHHSANWNIAGGPYDTQQQALDRKQALQLKVQGLR